MVYILYTNEQYTDAGQILYFLTKEKNLSVSSCCENWQALVRDIPEEGLPDSGQQYQKYILS